MKARRFGTLALLAIVAAVTSGALLAQAPQAIGTWVSVGEVGIALTNGAVVAMPDGRTLITGGTMAGGGTLTDGVTIYDPVDNSVVAAGVLTSPRTGHTATLLNDGRVLVVGGNTADGLVSSDIEAFDPTTGTSTIVALLPEPRTRHVAAGLPDGTVLIAGGATTEAASLQTAVLFDPETASISPSAGSLQIPRLNASATTLLDGRVLVVGGSNGTVELASAEIYDRYSQSFTIAATQMSVGRQGHSAVLLPNNGAVLVAGGTSNGVALTGVDLFLPAVFPDPFSYGEGEFSSTGAMTTARAGTVAGPTSVEGFAFAAGGGSSDAEVYRFATIKTDKDDYAPGELAVITGSGWQPGEEVTLLFQEDPAVHDDYLVKVSADLNGNLFWNQWAPERHDIGVRFFLTATDSQSRAQMTFTDAPKVGAVSVAAQAGTLTQGTPGSVTYTVTVTRGNSQAEVSALMSVGALPNGVSWSFSPSTVSIANGQPSATSTLTLTTTALSPSTTPPTLFSVTATQTPQDSATGNGTLTIDPAITPSSTIVSCPPSVIYDGLAQEPCSATVTGAGGLNQSLTVSYTANIQAGTVSASASFAGDATHTGSSDDTTFEIVKATSTTAVTCPADVIYDGSAKTPCTAVATGIGGLNESLAVSYSANIDAGTVTASAVYAGDTNHTDSSDSKTFEILKALSTTAVTCPATVTYDGTAHTPCTANVTGAGGLDQSLSVTYVDNTNAGIATASASYAGDSNHADSSDSKTFEILKGPSTTAVTCPATVIYDGTAHTPCTANVTGAGGLDQSLSVTYVDNTNAGIATASASYAGDANYADSSDSKTFEILKAPSTTVVTCPATVIYDGTAHTPCTANVTGANGLDQSLSVNYVDNTNAGIATASASYAGDANYADSSDSKTFEILKAPSTTAVTCPATVIYDGTAQTPCSAIATGVGGLNTSVVIEYAGNVNAGMASATATFAGDGNHDGSSDNKTFTIEKASSTTTLACPADVTYTGAAHTPCTAVATGAGGLNQALIVNYTNNINAGTATATASYDGDDNHVGSNGSAVFEIAKASSTTLVSCPASVTFNAAAQTPCTASVTGVGGLHQALTASYTNNVNAGTAGALASYGGDANHFGSTGSATFTIDKANAVCSITGYDVIFDNAFHTATGTCTGVNNSSLAGLNLSTTTHKAAGVYTDSWTFADVTGNYNNESGSVVDRINHWTTSGFYQPVDMSGALIVWNTVKGGSTVPLKFNLLAGTVNKTSVADVLGFAFAPAPCEASMIDTDVEFTTTGGTQLRYDGTAGQFIQNWQTPKTAGKCYVVQLTALDGSQITAYFKTK